MLASVFIEKFLPEFNGYIFLEQTVKLPSTSHSVHADIENVTRSEKTHLRMKKIKTDFLA